MINILIVEDNQVYLRQNYNRIHTFCDKINKTCSFYLSENANISDEILQQVDIACLDIDLGGGINGLELGKRIRDLNKWAAIIFITCFKEYEAAFKLQVYGYLSKPLNSFEMELLLERAIICTENLKRNHGIVTINYEWKKQELSTSSIIYVEKRQRKVLISTAERDYAVACTLISIEKQLNDAFIKINQGTLINMNEIRKVEEDEIYLKTNEIFKLSRKYRKDFTQKYKAHRKEAIICT